MISDLKKNIDIFVKTNITDKINKNDKESLNVYPLDYEYITDFRRQKLEERIKISH